MSPENQAPSPTLAYKTTPPSLASQVWRLGRVLVCGYDLFLSHRHYDGRQYALALWPRLEETGLTVCFDRHDFHVGERLHVKMRRTVTSSGGLLLLDTPGARESVEVEREIRNAIDNDVPIYVVRRGDLVQAAWPLVDGDDPLLYSEESQVRFEAGQPSLECIAEIDRAYTHRRVRTTFRWLTGSVAALLLALSSWAGVDWLFSARTAAIYSRIHDPRRSIQELDDAYAQLTSSLVLGTFGRVVRPSDLRALGAELSRTQLKPLDSPLTALLAASPPSNSQRSYPPGVPRANATVPSQAAMFAVHDGRLTRAAPTETLDCQGWTGTPLAVTVDPVTASVALATGTSLFVWDDPRCQSRPRSVEVRTMSERPQPLLRLSFGNRGLSVLLAWPDRVSVVDCSADSTCLARVTRTVADATPAVDASMDDTDMAFCEAAISPRSELVVTSVGQCDAGVRRDICVFTHPMKCERGTDRSRLAFDPTGRWVIGTDPVLSRWDVSGLVSAAEPHPPLDLESEWRFDKQFDQMTGTELAAFNSTGDRLLTTRSAGGTVLSLYTWPDLQLLQAETVPAGATSLAVDATAVVAGASGAAVFDIRRSR